MFPVRKEARMPRRREATRMKTTLPLAQSSGLTAQHIRLNMGFVQARPGARRSIHYPPCTNCIDLTLLYKRIPMTSNMAVSIKYRAIAIFQGGRYGRQLWETRFVASLQFMHSNAVADNSIISLPADNLAGLTAPLLHTLLVILYTCQLVALFCALREFSPLLTRQNTAICPRWCSAHEHEWLSIGVCQMSFSTSLSFLDVEFIGSLLICVLFLSLC